MNSSLAFAALAVVCGFPFLAVVGAATGAGDIRHALITRMGLDAQAASDVDRLISSAHHAVTTLTLSGAVLLALGAIGMASTLQTWYQKIYDQPPCKAFVKHVAYQVAGVLAFCVYIAVEVLVLDAIRPVGHVAMFALEFVFAVLFWWCSAYFLLYGKLGWLEMLPAGIATGICITGLGVFSALLFSDQISSGEKSYGPAGVVMVIASYLIGFGVCLHLGAVFGRIWNDRQRRATTEESSP